jgi:hypothetical protein
MGDFEGAADNSQAVQTSMALGLCYAAWRRDAKHGPIVPWSKLG